MNTLLKKEIRLFEKDFNYAKKFAILKFALGYPNTYQIGMSNIGFQWIYYLLNQKENVVCERFFLPDNRLNKHTKLKSFETDSDLRDFDVIGFSLPFELDFINIVTILKLAGIEPIAKNRLNTPIIVAGGISISANPEPIADFIDIFFIGEGEDLIDQFVNIFCKTKKDYKMISKKIPFKNLLFESLENIDSIYIPLNYKISYHSNGCISEIQPLKKRLKHKITPAVKENINEPAHSVIITTNTVFSNMFLIEISRGCPYNCRFCLAKYIGNKFRKLNLNKTKQNTNTVNQTLNTNNQDGCSTFLSNDGADTVNISSILEKGIKYTDRVGLVGTAFSVSSDLRYILEEIYRLSGKVSFSSIRLTDDFIKMVSEIGNKFDIKTLTLSPEVGNKRLQNIINKHFDVDILTGLKGLVIPSLRNLKLYFLLGIPGEKEKDIKAIAELSKNAREQMSQKKISVSISANILIPKPFTPFQWNALQDDEILKNKISLLTTLCKDEQIPLTVKSIRGSKIQTLLSIGDRRLSNVLIDVANTGDSYSNYLKALTKNGLSLDFYLYRHKEQNELFPWDILEHKIDKATLWSEYMESVKKSTQDLVVGSS